jgi:predicted DnaQ family exonuclease/DinG family helicase
VIDRIFVALDVETTGLEVGVDEIIEVAAVKFRGDEVLETFQRLVAPRQALPLKITRLTGITPADLEDAPRFSAIAPDLVRFLQNHPIIGHSINFDLAMLRSQGMSFAQPSYDTFEMATLLMPHAPAYKQSALAETLGIAHPEDHRALNDSDVCRQIFNKLIERIEALSLDELGEINRLTSKAPNWPLRELFVTVEKAKARVALTELANKRSIAEAPSLFETERRSNDSIPLKPTGDESPIDLDQIARFFSPQGAMGRAFEGYEQRAQQVQMAQAVATSFNEHKTLLVEAGTGTGKGMSYLVPSVFFAAKRGQRVVVSTNTINLQDQLFFKDIPALQQIMANDTPSDESEEKHLPFTAALLKGRGNYLCLRRYKNLRRDTNLQPEEVRALLKVQLWLPTTETGDKAEILLMDREQSAWGRINVTPDTCTGPKCPEFRNCFFFQARRRAESAHVVVVNHALLLADLASGSMVLPDYDHLVIDEAHNLEDVATDQLGFTVDQLELLIYLDSLFQTGGAQTVSGLLSELPVHFQMSTAEAADAEQAQAISDEMRPAIERARLAVYDFFVRLTNFTQIENEGNKGAYDSRLRLVKALRQRPLWREVEQAWDNLNLNLATISSLLDRLEQLLGKLEGADLLDYDELILRIQYLRRYAVDARLNIGNIILGDDDQKITWINQDRNRDNIRLHAAPLSVAGLLKEGLFGEKDSVVLASATMSIDGNFDFVKERLGVEEPLELQLDSPFDYEKQSLVFIPTDIPEPNQRGYQQKVEEALIKLCTATGGRTLALFTANSALKQTYTGIQDALEEQEIAVLGQNIDGSRRSILQRFKEAPRTVLLGTTSFWEGVDVVGDALSVLVIAKLPFSVPTDPIYAARSEQFEDPFNQFSVPQSILRFKQGFGRLIRSKEDRGIVVVLDKRLLSKKYGEQFLHSLPDTTVRTGSLQQLPNLAARFLV